MEQIFNVFIEINDNYANLLLLIVACVAAFFTYKEIVLRHRPYVIPEIVSEIKDNIWFFHVLLINKGEKPGIAKISRAILIIGDEEYSTNFKFEAILAPNERQKFAPMGHINELGRKKVGGNEYKINRVEIIIEVEARAVNDKRFKYCTTCEYKIDVRGDKPQIELIKEEIK